MSRQLIGLLIGLVLFVPGSTEASRAEVTYPDGEPRGVVLVLHGGAWASGDGEQWLSQLRPDAHWFNQHGWVAVNYSYEAGAASVPDVLAKYRRIRHRWPRLPVCAFGQSAGGHLALMLAARYRRLSCAIAVGAPTDLQTWAEGAWLPTMGEMSPARLPLRARNVLLVQVDTDFIVPIAQAKTYCRAHPRAKALYLRGVWAIDFHWGQPEVLMHGVISSASVRRYRAAKAAMLLAVQNPIVRPRAR